MSVEKFLKQRAVRIIVNGSYTLPNWYDAQGKLRTFACRTTRVSPFRMIVDRPYLFAIRHVESGAVAFAGYVADPRRLRRG